MSGGDPAGRHVIAGVSVELARDGANRNHDKLLNATAASIPIQRPPPTPEQR